MRTTPHAQDRRATPRRLVPRRPSAKIHEHEELNPRGQAIVDFMMTCDQLDYMAAYLIIETRPKKPCGYSLADLLADIAIVRPLLEGAA